jgi:hypothetical protein
MEKRYTVVGHVYAPTGVTRIGPFHSRQEAERAMTAMAGQVHRSPEGGQWAEYSRIFIEEEEHEIQEN